jgi:predicted DNA-binding transcriptional regulator YafY
VFVAPLRPETRKWNSAARGPAAQRGAHMNRTDRLVGMVMHLQGRRLVRAEDMAAHFEVSVRTIYRDIAALGEAGVPITGEAGVGYTLVRSYHLPPVMLTADEAAALFVGAEMVRNFTDASLCAPMDTALDKLRAVLPRDRQDHVERLARQTVVMGRMRNGPVDPAAQPWLLAVQRGVAQRRVLRLQYRGASRAEETQREVEPLGVIFSGGAWYLVGWCRLRGDVRHFRTDRIQRLEMLAETCPARPEFSLAAHLEQQMQRQETFPARVWFSKRVQERARGESYATLVEGTERDGGREFALYTYCHEWLARWLLSFGTEAEAIDPPRLRELVRAEAEAIAARYADSAVVG